MEVADKYLDMGLPDCVRTRGSLNRSRIACVCAGSGVCKDNNKISGRDLLIKLTNSESVESFKRDRVDR